MQAPDLAFCNSRLALCNITDNEHWGFFPKPFKTWCVSCDCVQTEAGFTDLNAGQNFTQDDVEMNRLFYKHTTFSGFKGHDRFHFFLSDGDNEIPPQSFFITVQTVQKGMCLKFYHKLQTSLVIIKKYFLTCNNHIIWASSILLLWPDFFFYFRLLSAFFWPRNWPHSMRCT